MIFRISNDWTIDENYFHVDLFSIHYQTNFMFVTILGISLILEKED